MTVCGFFAWFVHAPEGGAGYPCKSEKWAVFRFSGMVTTRTSRWLAGDRNRLWEEVLKQPGDGDSQRRGGTKRGRNGRAFVSRQAWHDEDAEVQQLGSCVSQEEGAADFTGGFYFGGPGPGSGGGLF